MRVRSISWRDRVGGDQNLTIGEFTQGSDYHTVRTNGTENFLLILTGGGSGRITGPEGQFLETEPGTLILFAPGSYHDYGTAPVAGSWVLQWCHFLPRPEWEFWREWDEFWPGLWVATVDPLTTQRLNEDLREALEMPVGEGNRGGAFALNCLERIWIRTAHARDRAVQSIMDQRLDPVLRHIMNHLEGPLTVDSLARLAGLSPSRFAHLFRQEIGLTPQAFVEAKRMELGRNLLRFSDLSISEIAGRCGYENPFYFSTRFRHTHGQSPRAFRRSPA